MGVSAVRFNGKDLYKPGYYAKRNIDRLNVGAASGSRMLIIGECKGGIPYNATSDYPNADDRVNWISNTTELKEIIRSGRCYDGALFALNPSNDPGVNGAPAVGIIRVNKATKGTKTIQDIDSDNVLDIESVGYGLYVNQIQFKLEAGTNKGKKVTTKFEGNVLETDDITYELFKVQYTGAGTACNLTIDPAGNLVTTTTGGSAGDDISALDLSSYDTVNSIVEYFNAYKNTGGVSVYSATLVGDGDFESQYLDKIIGTELDIKTEKTVSAILKAVQDYFNFQNEYLNAELSSGAERRVPDNMTSFEFLSGGSEGAAVTSTEWGEALDMAKLIDASFVAIMTNDASVASMLSTHINEMNDSSGGTNERQGGWGCDLNDTKSAKLTDAAAINNLAVGYFGEECERYDKNGIATFYPGFVGMCAIVGMSAGNSITLSPTNKSINCLRVRNKYSSSEIDEYIKGGVMVAQPSELGGIRVIRAITTYQGSNIIANEWSAVRTILYITKDHRAYVQGLVGIAGDGTALERIKNQAKLRLDFYEDQGFFVVDPDYGNSYRNYTFTPEADKVKIDYEATIVLPVNFILVTHNFTVIGFKG